MCIRDRFNNEAIHGASEEYSKGSTWGGVRTIVDEASDALESVHGINVNNINDAATETALDSFEQTQNYVRTEGAIANLITTYKDREVPNPQGGTAINIEILKGENIAELFAPLYTEHVYFKEFVFPAMRGVHSGAESLVSPSTFTEAEEGLKSVGEVAEQIEKFQGDINDYTDMGDTPVKMSQLGMTIYYAVLIGSAGVGILGSALFVFCGCNGFRCVSNLGCVLLTILMVLGFLVAAVLMPVSVVFIEACDLIDVERLKKSHDIIPDDIWDELKVCLVGDGDIYTTKNLGATLAFANNALSGLNIINALYERNSPTDPSCPLKYDYTQELVEKLEEMRNKRPDRACESAFTAKNVDDLTGKCKDDHIVWDPEDCPTGTDQLNVASLTTLTADGGCFAIMADPANCKAHAEKRYGSACTISDTMEKFCDYAKNIYDKLGLLIIDISNKDKSDGFLNKLYEDNYDSKVCEIVKATGELNTQLETLIDSLDTLGANLKKELNCTFIKDGFMRVHDATCGNFGQSITVIGIFVGVISAISFISITSLVCVNRRFYRRKVQNNGKGKN
eukprot:TRINITY_DN9402_c0_g5_i3.p1 TRINITY_DN9402_c0_g5~~TRINITY_DN9402_c0_g5_i3.p1  ORF type:complete len:580 (+),score=74.66 TRINITY_DN9402_c0_g5_i3:47-1741(+)